MARGPGTRFAKTPFGKKPFAWTDTALGDYTRDRFTLELENGARDLQYRLSSWGSAQRTRAVNAPTRLSFTYLLSDHAASSFTFPNIVVLRDEDGTALDRFHITEILEQSGGGTPPFVTVECENLLYQLGLVRIISPLEWTENVTVETVVRELLSATYQTNVKFQPIGIGTIQSGIGDVTLTGGWKFEKGSALQALRKLHDQVKGYFYVDAAGYLHWLNTLGGGITGKRITLKKNIVRMSVRTNFRPLVTDLTGIGRGLDEDASLTSNKTSSTQGTYGEILDSFSDREIWKQDRLDDVTQARVDVTGVPRKDFNLDMIDLSHVDTAKSTDHSFERLVEGERVSVVNPDLDVTIAARVLKIVDDLAFPALAKIRVSDPDAGTAGNDPSPPPSTERGAAQIIADIIEKLHALSEKDTGVTQGLIDILGNAAHGQYADLIAAIQGVAGSVSAETPKPVGAANVTGVRGDSLPADHEHQGLLLSVVTPASVGVTDVTGARIDSLPADHQHKGMPLVTSTTTNGVIYYSGTKGYMRLDGVNVCFTHLS